MELSLFLEAALRRTGALVERRDPDVLESLLPAHVAASLGLPEEARLRARGPAQDGEVQAGYGSPLLFQLCSLVQGAPRRWRVKLAPALPKRERAAREAEAALSFHNAVGRIESLREGTLEHALFDFRYRALSEEQHEGILSVAVDAGETWSPDLPAALPRHVAEHPESRWPWSENEQAPDAGARFPTARRLARMLAAAEAAPFIARMRRRLQRDAARVDRYYAALRSEIGAKRAHGGQDPQVLDAKVAAVEEERTRRLHDMRRRYAVTIKLEPLGVTAVRTSGLILEARLQRRKQERLLRVGWSPITRRFASWLCAGCGGPAAVPEICDLLHLLCAACARRCGACGRRGCAACQEDRCGCGPSRGPTGAGTPRS